MPTEHGKLYQDPIYGAKVLSPLAVAIIDMPEFQRLAGLKQLGFSDLVYRGAVHNRLQHSIGTYFACRTMMRRIVQNHERLGLEHPAKTISGRFRQVPLNSDLPENVTTYQSKWRGLTEIVSAAALLHDLGHVPFGHTLEDEFTGIYPRHDGLAGPRLYEMLFSESSGLARVFADTVAPWLQKLSNIEIRQLIYVILSWKDDIDTASGFKTVVQRAKAKAAGDQDKKRRLDTLEDWYTNLKNNDLFHPFMSDVVGNTICADLLDYLPRDRQHLGMEPRLHTRLQRYLTIREGTLYPDEGYRVSIMVTRKGRGGQRRDVATAVLDIMRERYEMAERVYYHHKKASASAMLVKLVELVGPVKKPRDDAKVYPAPWSNGLKRADVPHMVHLSDQELIDYLGTMPLPDSDSEILQRQLHAALRYKRTGIYRTLLVVDVAMADASSHSVSYLTKELRGDDASPSNEGRLKLERELEAIAGAEPGQVLIYCPSPRMQSKVVDARLEIKENRVLPLRVQTDSFAYRGDLEVLQRYYDELWRAYLFVAPPLFKDKLKCKLIVETFSNHFGIPLEVAHRKVRAHDFSTVGPSVAIGLETVQRFIQALPIDDVPTQAILAFLDQVAKDDRVQRLLGSGADPSQRLSILFQIATLKTAAPEPTRKLKKADVIRIEKYCESLQAGEKPYQIAAREGRSDYETFARNLIEGVLSGYAGPGLV
jgi:HD superfamily phosphohydrolase